LMCKQENALQTFKRKPPCSDKADSVIDLPIGAPVPQLKTENNRKSGKLKLKSNKEGNEL